MEISTRHSNKKSRAVDGRLEEFAATIVTSQPAAARFPRLSLPPLLLASPVGMNGLHRAVEIVLLTNKAPLLKTKREVICQNPNFSLAPKQISLYL